MPFCTQCGTSMSERDRFCLKCGHPNKIQPPPEVTTAPVEPAVVPSPVTKSTAAQTAPVAPAAPAVQETPAEPAKPRKTSLFAKKPSGEDYARLKADALSEYNELSSSDSDACSIMQKRWSEAHDHLKQVYKMSRKYCDTEEDTPVFKQYMEEAENRSKYFAHRAAFKNYLAEYEKLRDEHQKLHDCESDILKMDEDSAIYAAGKLHNRALELKRKYRTFKNDELNEEDVNCVCDGIAYCYCFIMAAHTTDNKYNADFTRDDKMSLCEDCTKLASSYSEDRFKIIAGIEQFELSEAWYELAKLQPVESAASFYSKVTEHRRNAMHYLFVLEKKDGMCAAPYFPVEWKCMKAGFWDLYNLYLVFDKDAKAYALAQKLIEEQEAYESIQFEDGGPGLCEQVREELKKFRTGAFGSIKYDRDT